MAKDRLIPCQHYICHGLCHKGRNAVQSGTCKTCNKYVPRKGGRAPINKKKVAKRNGYATKNSTY